jgi:hypothetical protein
MDHPASHRVLVRSPQLSMTLWTDSAGAARTLAEALHRSRPDWQLAIDGEAAFAPAGDRAAGPEA